MKRMLTAAAVAALLLAGCGGGDDTADTAASASEPTSDATTEDMATEMASEDMATEMGSEGEDIVALATSVTDLSILAGLLQEYGLVETLQGPGPFTVFAPVDTAFDVAAGTGTEDLAQLPEEDVVNILQGHVVEGVITPDQLTPDTTLTAVNGQELQITENDQGDLTVGGAPIASEVPAQASNGNVYTISEVILPSG